MIATLRDAWRGIRLGREMRSTSNLAMPSNDLLRALQGGPSKSGASVNEHTMFNVTVVRACVDLRANLLAMLPIKVFKKTQLGSEEQRDHPLAKLLRGRVSPAHTRFKWIKCSSVCEDIGGNAYSQVGRNAFAEVERIRWRRPIDVIPLENRRTGDIGYRVADVGDVNQWDVLHTAGLSTNGIVGRSPLLDLREAVGLSLTAEEFTARSFSNGNRKPGVLVGGQGMDKTKAETFLEFWMKNYAGAGNAGKSPLLFGGMEWKDAGFTSAEAEVLGTRKYSVEEVARVYQIPLHLVGSTEKSSAGYGANVAELNQGLVDYMLQPRCTNWESEMNTTLLTEREQEEGLFIKFNVDALLRGNPETRAKFYQAMRAIRGMTVNEIRRIEEMPEAPDIGANNLDWAMNNQGGGGAQPVAQTAATGADE